MAPALLPERAVTVTSWAVSQLVVVKVRVSGETVIPLLSEATVTVTVFLGREESSSW